MRNRDEIIKNFIDLGFVNNLMGKDKKAALLNPKLQLEVLLDIRELLESLKGDTKKIKELLATQ